MDPIQRLSALFERFPGIGPRQAERFVQFLLRSSPAIRRELVEAVSGLTGSVSQCSSCYRFSSATKGECSMCAQKERGHELLAVVAHDADIAALERSGNYRGRYFVLGGTISLASEKTNSLRIDKLLSSIPVRTQNGLKEIILAFPVNPEGEATMVRVREELLPLAEKYNYAITALGRGLSTGSELEYADPDTIKNALASRKQDL